jgi:BTB/POZ domain
MIFKVHREILAYASEVFQQLFAEALPDEYHESLPLVRVYNDSGEDICLMLTAIYHG